MEITTIIIILLLAIVISNLADTAFPRLPLPFIQIVCGMLLALTPLDEDLVLEPEVFMALLVAPLLFREAEEADLVGLIRVRRPVILMAFLLVFVTVFSIGFAVRALAPTLPLALCFALGAILGPTDAIAVSSMSSRVHIDDKIMSILKGEGLINDASGVISFHFAVAALLTGSFSLPAASLKFILVCGGGFLVGFALSFLKERITERLRKMSVRGNAVFMLIEVLTPFICYLTAELVGVSGIIAAVTAGSRQALTVYRVGIFEAEFGLFKKSLWEMLTVTFNALVFLLLGLQLPGIIKNIIVLRDFPIAFAVGLGALATLILFAVRFAGVLLVANEATGTGAKLKLKNCLILTLSGVKGTVSLATAFSLPYYFHTSGDFPQRDMILFVTATAIMLSLFVAMILLPLIADSKTVSPKNEKHIMVLREVLATVSCKENEYTGVVVLHIKKRIQELEHEDFGHKEKKLRQEMREFAVRTEMKIMEGKYARGEINKDEYRHYLRILLVMSELASRVVIGRIGIHHHDLGKFLERFEHKDKVIEEGERLLDELNDGSPDQSDADDAHDADKAHETPPERARKRKPNWRRHILAADRSCVTSAKLKDIFWANTADVIMALESKRNEKSDSVISALIDERVDLAGQIMEGLYGGAAKAELHGEYDKELLKSFELERAIIKRYADDGTLTSDEADKIRIDINMVETYMLEEIHNDNVQRLLASGIERRRRKHRNR